MFLRLLGRRYERADSRDLYFCYRLLLQREPDEATWQHWNSFVTGHGIDIQSLVDDFMATEEYHQLQEAGRQPVLVDLDGFQLNVRKNDHFVGAAIAQDKIYEPAVAAIIGKVMITGDTFVDIGANIGYFTCMAAALVGADGSVYAFEPNLDNILLLKRSIFDNGFTNVHLFPYAVAEESQTFKNDAGSSSNARIIDFTAEAVPGLYRPRIVEAVTLDETLSDVSRIEMVRLKIEGAEPRAWQGMQDFVRRHRPVLLFEFSPELLRVTGHIEPAAFLDTIVDAGYALYLLSDDGKKSDLPQSWDQILLAQERSGSTHLDLAAMPVYVVRIYSSIHLSH